MSQSRDAQGSDRTPASACEEAAYSQQDGSVHNSDVEQSQWCEAPASFTPSPPRARGRDTFEPQPYQPPQKGPGQLYGTYPQAVGALDTADDDFWDSLDLPAQPLVGRAENRERHHREQPTARTEDLSPALNQLGEAQTGKLPPAAGGSGAMRADGLELSRDRQPKQFDEKMAGFAPEVGELRAGATLPADQEPAEGPGEPARIVTKRGIVITRPSPPAGKEAEIWAQIQQEEPQTRVEIIDWLGTILTRSTVIILLFALRDTHWEVRAAAVQALGEWGGNVAIEALMQALIRETDVMVKQAIIRSLGKRRAMEFVQTFNFFLRDKKQDSLIREAAAWALGQLGRKTPVQSLVYALQHDADEMVRTTIAYVLGQNGSASARTALSDSARHDSDPEVRDMAWKALQQLARVSGPAWD